MLAARPKYLGCCAWILRAYTQLGIHCLNGSVHGYVVHLAVGQGVTLDYARAVDIMTEASDVAPRGVTLDGDDLVRVLVFQVTVVAAELMRLPLLQRCLTMPKSWFMPSTA